MKSYGLNPKSNAAVICPEIFSFGAQKKTSGNPSFLMFSGGEKTLALVISAGGVKKL
jgi:hypothetical protein